MVLSSASAASSTVALVPSDLEHPHHGALDRHPPRRLAHADVAGLAGRRQVDEDGDEDEEDVAAHQAEEAEGEGEPLADARRHLGRPPAAHAEGEQGAQHPAAVHREGRDQVEQHQPDVDRGEPRQEARRRLLDVGDGGEVEMGAERDQHRRDDDVDQRPGDGDDDLLGRVLRHARQARQPADGQQRDVRRGDAVAARGERMAEFVQHDAGEDGDDEDDAVHRRRRAAVEILGKPDPGEQDQEGQVDPDFAARDPRNGDRPGHRQPLRSRLPMAGMPCWI